MYCELSTYNCQLSLSTSLFPLLVHFTVDKGASGTESTGHTQALEQRGKCTSIDSAFGEEEEGDMSSLSDSDLDQELETARAEIAKHEYLILGRPCMDLPVF